jgi:DNA adenine methylase
MQYLGGKHRIAKQLAYYILPRTMGRLIEPFHGGLSASVALQPAFASDAFEPLTRLISAVRAGWEPPDVITEEMYYEARGSGTPLEGFAGFACSFGGKWYGGYARNSRGRNYAKDSKNALLRKMKALQNTQFGHKSYFWTQAQSGDTLYCDPPYAGTTTYKGLPPFDHELFWSWCAWQAGRGVLVFVSEFTGPPWSVLAEIKSKSDMHTRLRNQTTTEKLFMLVPK